MEEDTERALHSVEQFNIAIDRLLNTIETMYQNPQSQDHFGLKSFPIREGRYRIFYKVQIVNSSDFEITLADIDDNRQSNLDRFPEHLIIFDDEG